MDNQFYTKEQLVQSLADLYDNPNVEKSAAGGIFIFKYGKYVVDKYTPTELMREAHLLNSNVKERYAAELNGAFLMYRYFQNNPTEFNVSCGLSIQNISELFAAYLKNEGKSEATIDRYVKQVPNNSEVQNIVRSIAGTTALFDVMDVAKLLQISQKVAAQDFDQKGGNMYSAGINAYTHFISNYCLFVKHIARGNKKTTVQNSNQTNQFPLQQIFYGAPGTGKSHKVKEVTETLPKSDVFRTTFHPDSDYSTFVGCYKPKMVKAPIRDGSGHEITSACEDEKKRIAYEYEPQAFLKAYVRAYETEDPVFLVIEEINRGNCAQIFGDMFQLLDRNENGESDYAIKPETAIQEFLNEKLKDCNIKDEAIKSGEEMRLPANLHIWATMNTSDQSLFPIDSAFKRRWDWKYMPINTQKESWSIKVNGTEYSWSNFLEKINAEIDSVTHSEDKKLGFYFCKAENGVISAERFVSKVLFYIWNDVFKDYGFEKDIFNDTEGKLSFGKFYHDNGEIQEDKVELFLKNLAVEVLDDSNAMVDKFDDSKISNEQVKNERKESLVSVTINGKRFDKSNCSAQFDIYLSALREIGINRVAPLIMNMKYHREGKKMASSTTENLNNSNHLEYIQAGNYYFLKGIKSYTLIRILEDLKPLLDGVDLQIEYK